MTRPAIHPGEILKEEIEFLGMSAAEVSRTIAVPPNRVSQIVSGKRSISADTAVRLGFWLGTGPEFWMNLQQQYELRLAEQTSGALIRSSITPLEISSTDDVSATRKSRLAG